MAKANAVEAELEGKIDYTRQRDWFDPAKHPDLHVCMVGCGGIGSPTAFNLAKLGVQELTLIDHDLVEPHNLPNQMFKLDQVGKSKVEALKEIIEDFTFCKVNALQQKLEESDESMHGIIVSGLDSMKARKALWDMLRFSVRATLLIDGRIGGQDLLVHTIRPAEVDDVDYYEKYCMYTDAEGVEAPCTARGIYDVGTKMSSLITRNVRLWLTGRPVQTTIAFNQANLGTSIFPTEDTIIQNKLAATVV